jgi:hypothetical protein
MTNNCFQIHFNPVYLYAKKAFSLGFENDSTVLYTTATLTLMVQILQEFFKVNYFGVTNLTLILVIGTILLDAYYGIRKSVKQSKEAKLKHDLIEDNTPEKRALFKRYELKKFTPMKLQYTFFKALTLLGYLFFVKHILETEVDGNFMVEFIGFSSAIVLKAPLVIFWYYDFKSIGQNTEYVFGKKAPIFTIAEYIFEPKISKFFNSSKNE